MLRLNLSSLSLSDLHQCVQLEEIDFPWEAELKPETVPLTALEQQQIQQVLLHIVQEKVHLFNEATIWARAIYPLMMLAEQGQVRAWAEVAVAASYGHFYLEGVVDGVLGQSVGGRLETPYLVMVEAKRGVAGHNPVFQLYGQLLAAAQMNWGSGYGNGADPQTVFGCYTIADTWTFVRARVTGLESERPRLQVMASREYGEKTEAVAIVQILKAIVGYCLTQPLSHPPARFM